MLLLRNVSLKNQDLKGKMKIDAVITWVDGDDPRHRQKMAQYGPPGIFKVETIAGRSRYRSVGEIFWCVASINRFAPFINRIYIVTDGQDPGLEGFLERNFPYGYIPFEIVDHKTIFRGYEQYLPMFNSISIESMTWRIPGLSDHFIEFNDDMMLGAPVKEEDFFRPDGSIICHAEKINLMLVWLTRKLKFRKHGIMPVSFKGTMMNAAFLAGHKFWMLRMDHAPRALSRDFYESYFENHPEALERNIRHRFRDHDQYNPEELQFLSLYDAGKCECRPLKGRLFCVYSKGGKEDIRRKLDALYRSDAPFICFNSIDHASESEMKEIADFVSKRLSVEL